MRRPLIAVLAFALVATAGLSVAGDASAAYTQSGNGPQRTGEIPFPGPATNDTAFEVQLPGVPVGQPALVDGAAYATTFPGGGFDGPTDNLTEKAIWRIDLATGSVRRAFNFSEAADPLNGGWTDPDTILVEDEATEELYAVDVYSGEELWRTKAAPEDPRRFRDYSESVTQGGTVYVIFTVSDESQYRGPDRPTYVQAEPNPETVGVMAIDEETGQQIWTWNRTLTEASSGAPRPSDNRFVPETGGMSLSADQDRVYVYSRLAVQPSARHDTYIAATGTSFGPSVGYEVRRTFEIRALSAETGEPLWARNDTPQTTGVNMDTYSCCAYPSITETALYLRLDAFQALNPAGGTTIETSEAGRSDHLENQGSSAMGTRDGVVIGTSTQSVYRLDGSDLDVAWQHTSPDLSYGTSPVAMAEETVYIPTFRNGEDNFLDIGMEARDLATGELQWRWWHISSIGVDDPGTNIGTSEPALAPGVAVLPSKDGTVTVLGETEASLGEPAVPEDHYPPAGEAVSVTPSGAEPGAFGPATQYKAYWGDGTTTGWKSNPTLTHAYEEEGAYEARLVVGNDANQTSSTTITMHVGQAPPAPQDVTSTPGPSPDEVTVTWNPPSGADHPFAYRVLRANSTDGPYSEIGTTRNTSYTDTGLPEDGTYHYAVESVSRTGLDSASQAKTASQPQPPEPNLAQKAFAPRNQDMTFGIIGVVMALGGGAIGVTRRYRKRSRLQEELEALEEGYDETRHNPGQCEAFLDARKGRARSLLVDGTLTEEQVNVLENRIDELRREMRTGVLDERFQFLPYGMVQSMKGMLADGEISTWERSTLEDLLEEDEALNEVQREKVRGLLERWSEDASGGGGA